MYSVLISAAVAVQSLSRFRLLVTRGLQHAGLPILHHLPEFAQLPVYWVGGAIPAAQPSDPVIHAYTYSCSYSFHWGLSPDTEYSSLCCTRILSIYSRCTSLHLLIPNSQTILSPPPPSGVPFLRAKLPSPSWPNYLSKAPAPNITTWGVRISTCESGGRDTCNLLQSLRWQRIGHHWATEHACAHTRTHTHTQSFPGGIYYIWDFFTEKEMIFFSHFPLQAVCLAK